MKKIYFILCSLLVLFTACQDEFYDATYISNTEISVHSSTADVLIYVCDQDGQRTRATIEEVGVFLSTSTNPTEKDERHSLVIKGDNWNVYRQVYNEAGGYAFSIDGLSANTTYYALPFISNRWGMVTGKVVSFTTNGTAKVTTKAATQITTTTAQLNGTITLEGNNVEIEERGFVLATTTNPTIQTLGALIYSVAGTTGDYKRTYTGLQSSTRYYFRGFVVVDGETLYGNVLNFTTLTPDDAITLSLNNVTDITNNSAKVSGSITIGKEAVGQISECGFIAATDNNPTFNSSWYRTWYYNSSNNSDFSTWSGQKNLSGTFQSLSQATTYYYRMYYKIGTQYYYGTTIKSFRTTASSQSYYTVAQIINIYNTLGLASGSTSSDTYTVRGYVTKWNNGYPDYQNADFWIDDSPTGSTSLLNCFRIQGLTTSDQRTLVVGDYVEVSNCYLLNYNGKAELTNQKGGTYTIITAASQASTLGSQVSDFVGMYHASVYLPEMGNNLSWDTVKIYTYTTTNQEEKVCVEGLAGGYSFDVALGEFNATNKALQLHRGTSWANNTFNFQGKGDTAFFSVFYPIYFNSTNDYGLIDDISDGEAWLTFDSNGNVVLSPSNTADSKGHYANGYTFEWLYADNYNFFGWDYLYTQLELTKFSSTVSAPTRSSKQTTWHAPMKLPAKIPSNKALRKR